jgi:protein-L-isoaspartate(D-aspartate) O-methyltransferase
MTEALDLTAWIAQHGEGPPRALDVGTGSGYQAAVLAECGAEVVSIERDEELALEARERLAALGYRIEVVVGDGSLGWPPQVPYAGIIVAAAAPDPPPPLLEQLEDGGRLVVPIGTRNHQDLVVLRRRGDRFEERLLEPCVFVPLVGRYGFREADPPFIN